MLKNLNCLDQINFIKCDLLKDNINNAMIQLFLNPPYLSETRL